MFKKEILKKEMPISHAINCRTISQGWMRGLELWNEYGVISELDNGDITKRINLVLNISNPMVDQVHPYCPITPRMMNDYINEITEEYADFQDGLSDNDPKKFEYNYASYIFRQEKKIKSFSDLFKIMMGKKLYHNNMEENLLNLRENSRRHCGALWQNEIHIPKFEDQPCWCFYKLELMNTNELVFYAVFRSWDLFRGMPANLPAISQGIMKKVKDLGLPYQLKHMVLYGMDVHVYKNAWDDVEEILNKSNNIRCPECNNLLPKGSLIPYYDKNVCFGCRYS